MTRDTHDRILQALALLVLVAAFIWIASIATPVPAADRQLHVDDDRAEYECIIPPKAFANRPCGRASNVKRILLHGPDWHGVPVCKEIQVIGLPVLTLDCWTLTELQK